MVVHFNRTIIRIKHSLINHGHLKLFLYRILGVLVFIAFWELLGRLFLFNPNLKYFENFLPLPAFKELFFLIGTSTFWKSVLDSMRRIFIGLLIAFVIGLINGLLIGFYKNLKAFFSIPIQFVRMISPLSWMPIALIILPGFEQTIIFLITVATVWPIMLNTAEGVGSVNPEWIKMARNQGAKEYQLFLKVIFPATIPYILTGLRLSIGVAWIVLVPAELLGISSGLGYLINDARDTLEYGKLMAIVIAIGMIGFTIDLLFSYIQKHIDWKLKG